MVGNLQSGDYTLVSFAVTPKTGAGAGFRHQNQTEPTPSQTNQTSTDLNFDIYYTDNLGGRRVVSMALPVHMGNSTGLGSGKGTYGKTSSTTSSSSTYLYIVIIVLVIAGIIFYRKNPERVKSLFSKSSHGKSESSSGKVPD